MARKKNSQTKRRTSSSKTLTFGRRRLCELTAVCSIVLGVFLALSLITYDSGDPSFNHVPSSNSLTNMGGKVGAHISDMMLQLYGMASIVLVAAFIAWGWRFLSKRSLRGWRWRIISVMLLLILAAGFFGVWNAPASWPIDTGLGGAVGMTIGGWLAGLITPFFAGFILCVGVVLLVPFAMGLQQAEWIAMYIILRHAFSTIGRFFGFVRAAFDGDSKRHIANKKPSLWEKLAFWKMDYDEEIAEEKAAKPAAVKRPVKKVVEKKEKPPEPEQSSFELRTMQGDFALPAFDLLSKAPKSKKSTISESALSQNAKLLESVLADFGVKGEITKVRPGPVVTLYELEPAAGTKSSRVIGLADDIARSMSAISARISVIPGRNALGVELPNSSRETVYLREMLESSLFQETDAKLPLALGKDIGGDPIIVDLAKMPHLLVAGTTGSGKSVAINTMLLSLMYHNSPEQCKFIMIDPKMLELSVYDGIPHLLSPVVTEPGKAVVALKWTVKEMENRYRLMSSLGVRNVESYNKRVKEAAKKGEQLFRTVQTGFDPETGKPIMEKVELEMNPLPFIVVVVDEMADLMLVAGKDIEGSIQRLAQMARAAGIHIIMATQRPSVDVITGVIKANFPTRISFQVTSKIDSRTILGEQGAEQLLGMGDMLYMAGGGRVTRVHGPFAADKEVEGVISYLKTQGEPVYDEMITIDESADDAGFGMIEEGDAESQLYAQAVQIVMADRKASTSYIQRKLKIGYNRAARLIDRMEEEGIVGAANHVGKREILMRQGEG